MTSLLELEGMEFHSNHGCYEDEKKHGNLFVVDFMAEIDVDKAAKSDNLADTVDLAQIYAQKRRWPRRRTSSKTSPHASSVVSRKDTRVSDISQSASRSTILR